MTHTFIRNIAGYSQYLTDKKKIKIEPEEINKETELKEEIKTLKENEEKMRDALSDFQKQVLKLNDKLREIIKEIEKIYLKYIKEPKQSIKADLEELLGKLEFVTLKI